jgi:hypothetical protein
MGDDMDMDAEMDDDMDMDAEMDDDMDMDMDSEDSVSKEELGDIKDKLDDLMAEFESLMGDDSMDLDTSDDLDSEEDDLESEIDDFEDEEEDEEADLEDEEEGLEDEDMMEAVQLQKVPGLYGSKIGGDDGQQKKSPIAANSGARGMGSKPVKFAGAHETVPTSPKRPSNEYSKKEGSLIGDVGNTPGKKKASDLKAAPKPVTSQASGVNNRSPVSKG